MVCTSLDAANKMKAAGYRPDMVFIDGGHKYDEVISDLLAWNPLVTQLIAGHDYTNMAEVQRAVKDFFHSNGKVQMYGSIWYVEK